MRKSPVVVRMPDHKLARFISHYWLSVSNPFPAQRILPDGRVDLVIESTGSAAQSWIYGTTTRPATVAITPGFHYLGIQFKPGQSRHFVTLPTQELTDSHAPAQEVLRFLLDGIAEQIGSDGLFSALDDILIRALTRRAPQPHRVDTAIQHLTCQRSVRIDDLARSLGISRRHFERLFLDCVGVPPKMFAAIQRYRAATRALSRCARGGLADVAVAMGYADQSHMTRDFTRLTGDTPLRFLRGDVAFVQDFPTAQADTGDL